MQVEVDLIAIAHQKRMEAIANRHCRHADKIMSDTFLRIGEPLPFLEMRCRKDILGTTLTGLCLIFCHASCNLQETFFFYQNKRIFLNKPNIIKEKFGLPRKFLKRTQTAKKSVCVAKPLLLAIKCCATATFLVMWGCCCQSGLFGAHWN